jgi:hypothetical protein
MNPNTHMLAGYRVYLRDGAVLIRNALDPEMRALIECGDEEAYHRPPAEPSHRLETIALSARARMGSDHAAVVDERLAVHDASGLKVFDVSALDNQRQHEHRNDDRRKGRLHDQFAPWAWRRSPLANGRCSRDVDLFLFLKPVDSVSDSLGKRSRRPAQLTSRLAMIELTKNGR